MHLLGGIVSQPPPPQSLAYFLSLHSGNFFQNSSYTNWSNQICCVCHLKWKPDISFSLVGISKQALVCFFWGNFFFFFFFIHLVQCCGYTFTFISHIYKNVYCKVISGKMRINIFLFPQVENFYLFR